MSFGENYGYVPKENGMKNEDMVKKRVRILMEVKSRRIGSKRINLISRIGVGNN